MTAYFGSPDQQALARRAAHLWNLVGDDARLTFYGRTVGLTSPDPGLDLFEDLVRLQGVSVVYRVPRPEIPTLVAELEARGVRTDLFGFARSFADSVAMARELLHRHALPADLEVTRLGPESPEADIADFAEVALESEVLPPPEAVLRGLTRRGVFLLARECAGGRAVATGAAVESFHPAGTFADTCNWGLLATRPDRRGQRIAPVLGAQAMLTINRECGFTRFVTGIRDDNAPSLALSARLGVGESGMMIVVGMDPSAFTDARITK